METGAYKEDYQKIREASILAMEAGADFIKTSTGKLNENQNATPEAVFIMAEAIKEFNEKH